MRLHLIFLICLFSASSLADSTCTIKVLLTISSAEEKEFLAPYNGQLPTFPNGKKLEKLSAGKYQWTYLSETADSLKCRDSAASHCNSLRFQKKVFAEFNSKKIGNGANLCQKDGKSNEDIDSGAKSSGTGIGD